MCKVVLQDWFPSILCDLARVSLRSTSLLDAPLSCSALQPRHDKPEPDSLFVASRCVAELIGLVCVEIQFVIDRLAARVEDV